MTTAAPFVVSNLLFGVGESSKNSIFDDVESAKLRVVEARRASKRPYDGTQFSRASQHVGSISSNANDDRGSQRTQAMRSLLEAESSLVEVVATRAALEKRRSNLYLEIRELTSRLESLRSGEATEPEKESASDSVQQRKKPRYFEIATNMPAPERSTSSRESEPVQDDLSTVICPYELMGQCTDPECPHMHLNR